MISSKKLLPVTTIRRNLCACQTKEALYHDLIIYVLSFLQAVQISMNHMTDSVLFKQGSGYKLRILEVYLVLFIITVVCKFCITGNTQASVFIRPVCHGQLPHLIFLVHRDIIQRLRMDFAVVCKHSGIAGSMTAFAFVFLQAFSYRLPGSRPVVL